MGEAPGLRTVYAPAYHVHGALLNPLLGLASYPRAFALLAAACWIAGFRFFQRASRLPDASAALFALSPYGFALTWCVPKVEMVGYALAFVGLGLLARRRYVLLALSLAATFLLHTASAIFLGLAGGIFALASRDVRGLLALAAGSFGFLPLLGAHVAAGCSPAQALMLSENDYLRASAAWSSFGAWDVILVLANPFALGLGALGARALWRTDRPLAVLCGVLVLVYLNELWLSPFETRTSLDLLRGLSVLAVPTAAAAGVALRARPRALRWMLGLCAVWSLAAVLLVVPRSCHVRAVDLDELRGLRVARCSFRWQGPGVRRLAPTRRPERRLAPAPGDPGSPR
jgi:hypothetical protein